MQEVFNLGVTSYMKMLHELDTDTAAMAEDTENAMYEHYNGTTKEYKTRFRSLMFNLKDPNNTDFIMKVVTGQLHVSDLAAMEVKEMASSAKQEEMKQLFEHRKMALMDDKSYKKYAGLGQEDGILKCPRCKSMKTEYTEVQTRSADEPTTKKCFCNTCEYRWKFC